MDRIFEFGNSVFEAASEKINNINIGDTKRYISERAGNVLGMNGAVGGAVYEINGRRFTERQKIAEGGFGIVYLVRDDYGQDYALKRMFVQDREKVMAIKNEIDVMKKLGNHKNIVKLEAYKMNETRNETEFLMVLEYCSGGSVLDIMNQREHSRLSEREILAIFSDTCHAVMAMHNLSITHRDLKIENILFCERSRCYKLCDFGSSTTRVYDLNRDGERSKAEDDINTFTTLLYRAPEMVDLYQRNIINEKVDIWALGCVLYKMAYYNDPFDGTLGILNNRLSIPENSKYSPPFNQLIQYLLVSDPAQRPTIFDVLNRLESFKNPSRRSGLQTFSPQKPTSSSLNNSNGNGSSNSLNGSNNSTPSYSPPQPSTPTNQRKQNLFDMLDWQDGSSNQQQRPSTPSQQQPVTPTQQKSKPTNNNNDDGFGDWNFDASAHPGKTSTGKPTNNNINLQSSSSSLSSFDPFDDFATPSPSSSSSSIKTNQPQPQQQQQQQFRNKQEEITFDKVDLFNNNFQNKLNINNNNNNFNNNNNYHNNNMNQNKYNNINNNTNYNNNNNNFNNNMNQNLKNTSSSSTMVGAFDDFGGWNTSTPSPTSSTSSFKPLPTNNNINSTSSPSSSFSTDVLKPISSSTSSLGSSTSSSKSNSTTNSNNNSRTNSPMPSHQNIKPNYNIDFNAINNGLYTNNNNQQQPQQQQQQQQKSNQFGFDSFEMYGKVSSNQSR